jgi:RNA polymerase sigma-70 factor (ECF subfamily)
VSEQHVGLKDRDLADGDFAEADLADLYRRYAGWLAQRLRRRFGAEAADDLIQETWLRLAPLPHLEHVRHPRALLLRIATNIAIDGGRRRARERLFTARDSVPAAECAVQHDALLLKQVILSLSQPLRDVFVLSRFGGLTYDEIAVRLGLSVKTVEWRMSKALAHCSACLRP